MHYINVIDFLSPDDFFMYMSSRINSFNIQRNNLWTMCKINNYELSVYNLSKYISEYIWENTLPRLCMNVLNRYPDMQDSLRKDIVSRTMHVAFCLKNSSDIVYEKIAEYIDSGNCYLVIDGFVNFRLKGLVDDIKTLLAVSVQENYIEDEYNDFVLFMKEIVSEQSSLYDEIFLIEGPNGFKILSDDGSDITQSCVDAYVNDKNKINYQDSIISSVVSIAPKKIFLHCSDETFCSSFCELIKGIFSGRVVKY
ncbi:MAG: hypothetical protein IJZ94_03370 [Clostridia bacterium]|nr:hypothetical protein [Clostridia bacterium]